MEIHERAVCVLNYVFESGIYFFYSPDYHFFFYIRLKKASHFFVISAPMVCISAALVIFNL